MILRYDLSLKNCFLVGTFSQIKMEVVTPDPATRSSSFRVTLMKPLIVPI